MEVIKSKKLNICINPRQLVSERVNPIEKNYEVLETIGQGGYGEVKKVRHKDLDVIRALKIIRKTKYRNPAELKMIKSEISNMKLVDHPNIIKLFEFFEDQENFYIITEYCTGGQLFEAIMKKKTFSENEAANIIQQLLSAVAHCH
jgi:calcium-dependent protein kinase